MMDSFRLSELERKLANTVLVGKVEEVSETFCRVAIGDLLTCDLPMISFRKLEKDDPVLVIAHNGDLSQAFAIGTISQNGLRNFRLKFSDGTEVSYDQTSKILTAATPGTLTAQAAEASITATTSARVQAPAIALAGNVEITGTLRVAGAAAFAAATVAGTALVPGGENF